MRIFKWSIFGVGGLIMTAAGVSPRDAASNLSAWVELLGLEAPVWLMSDSADKYGLAIGFILAVLAYVSIKGWGAMTTVHLTRPFLRRISTTKKQPNENTYNPSEQSKHEYDTPIHEAVDYVIRKIDDSDTDKFYPSARRGLRKAAYEGRIKMHGKRELKNDYPSDLRTPIPPEFWDDQELNEITTSEAYIHHVHTKAETGEGFMKLGRDRDKYWDIRVSMDEVRKEWP